MNHRCFNQLVESIVDKTVQIIDYIKGFGRKGKLPSCSKPLKAYYSDALQSAYEWACESTEGVSRDGFAYFRHHFMTYAGSKFKFNKRGLVYVERAISLDASQGFGDLGFNSVGECWTWKRGHSRAYCSDITPYDSGCINVVLCGYVHPSSVDWVETIYLNSYDMKEEHEVRMNDNALVEITYLRINGEKYTLGGSYLINASADRQRKKNWD